MQVERRVTITNIYFKYFKAFFFTINIRKITLLSIEIYKYYIVISLTLFALHSLIH